ncbi:cytidylate kinase [Alkalispirochaeta sphaeroplastigenens]|uniref:Cytidylate kinase n=1 Tax=Alkalispirochaeta sphaeroplastigenens TaxID=1187066 RepID=A0A2S4JQI4_9SPIO|nr:AAA family ATPase [Alkalispirochaeta sphaeroplastigenens]POR01775.1 cytidylate kinase [Alkalispirochaeta sphaeroplastigenens]
MKPLRIAISGKSGCGNTTVSRLLAETLGVELVNYTFHTMAEEEGVSFEEMCRRAESDDSWDRLLDQRQVEKARAASCVLASRLAIWLLQEADLKVYLQASPEVRAARIHQREGGTLDEVQAATRERDRRDHARYVRLYNIDVDSWNFADLVVDTERYRPEEIVPLIVQAVKDRG